MLSKYQSLVSEFNKAIKAPVDVELRVKLIQEEAKEFVEAVRKRDIIEAIDALCDSLYVVYGAADVFDVVLDTAIGENTAPLKTAPAWATVDDEAKGDFDWAVNEVVKAIRSQDELLMKTELTDFAEGLWECGAQGLGVDLRPFFREVHRTNMHKLTGPIRPDGKKLKPAGWKPPRIKAMYYRLQDGKPAICEYGACRSVLSVIRRHENGGSYCSACGGLFVDVDLTEEMLS